MYFQSSNYIVEPGVFTRTTQKGIYQMQFNPSNNTFHLYLQAIFMDSNKDKNIVRKESPDGSAKHKDVVENIIKEFDAPASDIKSLNGAIVSSNDKDKPSSPQGVQNDRVSFFVFATH